MIMGMINDKTCKISFRDQLWCFFVSSSCKENLQRVDLLFVIKVDVEKSFAS